MELTEAQNRAIEMAGAGENVFLSGSAGTGKSFTIDQIREQFPHFAITASTGIAAINISGITLHRWSGIKPGQETVDEVMEKLWWKTRDNMTKAKALLVDEISMVSGNFLDLLDGVLKRVRHRPNEPFGGLQVIVVGDFLQLPPVGNDEPFCFESDAWKEANFHHVKLTKVFRQEKDTTFIDFLTSMRKGELTGSDLEMFRSKCCVERDYSDYVQLFPTNRECDNLNYGKLGQLPKPDYCYDAKASGDKYEINLFFKNSLIQPRVDIRVGARVMMLSNTHIELGIANGSTGEVIEAIDGTSALVKFDNGETVNVEMEFYPIERTIDGEKSVVASITQIPLRLSWAITVHKSQGMSLEKVYCNFQKTFSPSQVYVALSRAKDMQNLYVENFHEHMITFHPKAIEFVNS